MKFPLHIISLSCPFSPPRESSAMSYINKKQMCISKVHLGSPWEAVLDKWRLLQPSLLITIAIYIILHAYICCIILTKQELCALLLKLACRKILIVQLNTNFGRVKKAVETLPMRIWEGGRKKRPYYVQFSVFWYSYFPGSILILDVFIFLKSSTLSKLSLALYVTLLLISVLVHLQVLCFKKKATFMAFYSYK